MGTRGIPNQYGGFEQFTQYLSAGLVQKGHHVSVYCSHTHPYQQPEWKGVQLIHCKDPENKWGTAGQFFYDRNCIRDSHHRSFDVLLHLGYTSDSIWHRQWPKGMKHIVNMDGLEWKRAKYNHITRLFLKKAEAWAAHHADFLVADSTAIQEYLQEEYEKKAVYIPYGAAVYANASTELLNTYNIKPGAYYLAIARMEPENNLEMVIKAYLSSGMDDPLQIIGNTNTPHAKKILSRYTNERVRFIGGLYDEQGLNDLRYHCKLYFHGHSAGGTNPSLLEAMACGCAIAAHDNPFNRAVTGEDAQYFRSEEDIIKIFRTPWDTQQRMLSRQANVTKIETVFSHEKITLQYEELMMRAVESQ